MGLKIEQGRIAGGVWEGVLTGAATAPGIEVLHEGRAVEGVEVHPVTGTAGSCTVRVPIPAWALNDGVQSFLVQFYEEVPPPPMIPPPPGVMGKVGAMGSVGVIGTVGSMGSGVGLTWAEANEARDAKASESARVRERNMAGRAKIF